MKAKNLKLIARAEKDLKVVSAHLQDSIASISDIANLKKDDFKPLGIMELLTAQRQNGLGNLINRLVALAKN